MFASLNYLQADIYYKIFKDKISKANFELCLLNECETYEYSNFLFKNNSTQISTPQVKYLALDSYLSVDLNKAKYFQDGQWLEIQQNYNKQDLLFLLHKSRYPKKYNLNFDSVLIGQDVELLKEISLRFDNKTLNLSPAEIKKMVFLKDFEFIINPLSFLNYLQSHEIDFSVPVLDLNNYENFKNKKIPNFPKLIDSINQSLNKNIKESQIRVEYTLPVPALSSNLKTDYFIQRSVYTSFYGSNFNRDFNIQNAIKKLQLIKLEPNQEFSFLESIGEISKETGYKDSLVITKEGFVSQAGGGVCQVSSTVYYAALNAGFPILERYNHSKAISYYAQAFDYGLDATIYPGQKDLRFKNHYPFEVMLFSYYFDSTMQTLILAPKEIADVQIDLILKEVDHSQNSLVEINKEESQSLEPKVIQNYIPKITTLWERKVDSQIDQIHSHYRSQPKIIDYSNN
tara:strand:- start:113 stop:1483 length:1371 start_codon:yes stop_codon:yes gene_type:complete